MNTTSILTWPALLAALRKTPERLRELVSAAGSASETGAGTQQAVASGSGADQWSVCQIVGHMSAIESPFRARLARIMWEDNPHITMIGCITGDYDPNTPASMLLDTFARLRADTVAFLWTLPVEARARPAVHAELGPVTLRSQVEALLAHDEEHLAQIARLVGRDSVKTC